MSWLSSLNPMPSFPDYTGPYKVGSVDVELPTSELDSPAPAPTNDIPTVQFRIFYPCQDGGKEPAVRWVPNPQRGYIGAFGKFLGGNPAFSDLLAFVPMILYYVQMPARQNAKLLQPQAGKRWPVMVFSHGLGGSRNAYSHLCGSLASHGMVVIASDHRDRSAPVSYINQQDKTKAMSVPYSRIGHEATKEVWSARDAQLRIRLWELGLIHDSILKIDTGKAPKNLEPNAVSWRGKDYNEVLSQFKDQLEVHTPGSIAWAGHSFGGATMYQFVKSVWYAQESKETDYEHLYRPSADSAISEQITPSSSLALLDMWCLPLQSPATKWLHDKPLPCFTTNGPGGTTIISVLSEAFFKWRDHLLETKRVLSEAPGTKFPPHSKPPARFFYPLTSAHLSQSDFGVLFPWLIRKVLKAEEPERTLRLNVRAILQTLRDNGMPVADTSRIDREEGELAAELAAKDKPQATALTNTSAGQKDTASDSESDSMADSAVAMSTETKGQDWEILDPNGKIRGWIAIEVEGGVKTPGLIHTYVESEEEEDGGILGGGKKSDSPLAEVTKGEVKA